MVAEPGNGGNHVVGQESQRLSLHEDGSFMIAPHALKGHQGKLYVRDMLYSHSSEGMEFPSFCCGVLQSRRSTRILLNPWLMNRFERGSFTNPPPPPPLVTLSARWCAPFRREAGRPIAAR